MPQAAAGTDTDSTCGQNSIHDWLAEKGLAELAPTFIEKKYTDVAAINAVGLDDDDLNYLGIQDLRQRAVLKGDPEPPASPEAPGMEPADPEVRAVCCGRAIA